MGSFYTTLYLSYTRETFTLVGNNVNDSLVLYREYYIYGKVLHHLEYSRKIFPFIYASRYEKL